MSDEEKVEFDAETEANQAEDQAYDEAARVTAGFADMSADAKVVYDAELLVFLKAAFENCENEEKNA